MPTVNDQLNPEMLMYKNQDCACWCKASYFLWCPTSGMRMRYNALWDTTQYILGCMVAAVGGPKSNQILKLTMGIAVLKVHG